MRHLKPQLVALHEYLPELWEGGTLLYIGAMPDRWECGAELKEAGHENTIMEVYEPYAECYKAGFAVVVGDVRGVGHEELPHNHYDVAFWWHGPEHVKRDEIEDALRQLEAIADLVVIGCPNGELVQGALGDNPYQTHQATLYPEDFRSWGYEVTTAGRRDGQATDDIIAWRWSDREPSTVIACINAYNEERLLPGCLDSVQGQVDRIIVVDGRYERFPGEGAASTDATVAIARAFGAEVIIPPNNEPWESQPVKRSAYLLGEDGDWYFRIDADERLRGKLPDVRALDPEKVYALKMVFPSGLLMPWVPCLFEHRGVMCYDRAHCALWRDGELVSRNHEAAKLEGAYFIHLKHYREPERVKAKNAYYAWQRQAEGGFRRQWKI